MLLLLLLSVLLLFLLSRLHVACPMPPQLMLAAHPASGLDKCWHSRLQELPSWCWTRLAEALKLSPQAQGGAERHQGWGIARNQALP